jgi:hypothetical protein
MMRILARAVYYPMADRAGQRRIGREKATIEAMVRIYCHGHHGTRGREVCADCAEFLEYAYRRLDRCRWIPEKPTCGRCPVHCYGREMRARAVEVMRYAGPRMAWRHPLMALWHFVDGFRKVEDPRARNRP